MQDEGPEEDDDMEGDEEEDEEEAVTVGSRVEVSYHGTWYKGSIVQLPEDASGEYTVQCDADAHGTYTKGTDVRLLDEAEATDESLGEAENDRDALFEEANDLNREIQGLQAKEDEQSEEIEKLTKQIAEEEKSFKEATDDRKTEKDSLGVPPRSADVNQEESGSSLETGADVDQGESISPAEIRTAVPKNPVNLRSEPIKCADAEKFNGITVQPGVPVQIVEERGDWALVKNIAGTGWIRKIYLDDDSDGRPLWEVAEMPTCDYRSSDYNDLMAGMHTCRQQNPKVVPLLEQLQERDFFSLFPFDLIGQCRYMSSKDSQCDMDMCEVHSVRNKDVPPQIMKRDEQECHFQLDGWTRKDMPSDFTEYYDLREEPERNTGYNGARVWRFIHQKICFADRKWDLDTLANGWKRDFNRAISGMHAVVDTNVIDDMKSQEEALAEYRKRLRDEPGCIANLYFTYMLSLEAIRDMRVRLDNCNYVGEGDKVRPIMRQVTSSELVNSEPVQKAAQNLRKHATSPGAEVWKARLRIRDLFAIMDCVQCNLCRLHGKVMTLGLGATFQVLLGDDGRGGDHRALDRKEVGALVAFAIKLGKACEIVERFKQLDTEDMNRVIAP